MVVGSNCHIQMKIFLIILAIVCNEDKGGKDMASNLKKITMVMVGILTFFLFNNTVSARELDITPDMTQEEIDAVLMTATSQDNITIASGDYSTEKNGKNYHKIITVQKDYMNFNIAGNYTELQFVVRSSNTKITANDATIDGNASTEGNPSAALFIEQGSVILSGNLTLTDHNHGVRLGYANAGTSIYSALTLSDYATLSITNSVLTYSGQHGYYGGGYDDPDTTYSSPVDQGQGNGTSGSAIDVRGKGNTSFILGTGAKFYAQNNARAGIFAINVTNFTFNMNSGSYALFDGNGQGICMNTDYAGSVNINVNNATLDITNNSSNGITGQSSPYILDITNKGTVNLNNNGGIGINNFYIKVTDSTLNVNGNGSHGATNVSMDATNSTINVSDNAYIGLNITKYNAGKESTDIVNSTITANNNGGPGVRFYIENGVTNITDSNITTNEDGYGDSIYGFEVRPGDSGYWAGVVIKGTLSVKNSTMMSDGVSGYSLYDTSSGKAVFYVLENSVVVGNGDESKDIFDDYNSGKGNSGSTVVEGGSLQIDNDNVSSSDSLNNKYHQEQNPTMPSGQGSKDEVQYAGPVNSDNTALTEFILHQNINKEVGGAGSHTFTYYDPNTGKRHDYTFRYNELGEDLDPNLSGNAYIWTPVSILRYDATEGFISSLGTAGLVKFGYGYTDLMTGLYTRYTSDVTIFGNSMNLAEKVLALASREGYVFLGWYIADDQELAAKYAEEGNFEELYKLLNTKFDGSTKLVIDGVPVSELTVYAKWAIADDEPGTGFTPGPSEELEITPPSTGVIASKNIYTELLIIISVLGIVSLYTALRNKD